MSKKDAINALNAIAVASAAQSGSALDSLPELGTYQEALKRAFDQVMMTSYEGKVSSHPNTLTAKQKKARKKSKAAKQARKRNRK